MIDLTDAKFLPNRYAGSEKKKTLRYNGKLYMVKFPDPIREKAAILSYMNNSFSEDIGCRILKSIGFETQNTFLASYTEPTGKNKIVVACEDFCQGGKVLSEFSKLLLSDTDSVKRVRKGVIPIEPLIEFMQTDSALAPHPEFIDKFWDLFVADTLIGNKDRHLDNFGFLLDDEEITFAPIYDCGSALSPLLADEQIEENFKDMTKFKDNEFNISTPYSLNGQRVFFSTVYKNPPEALTAAVKRVVPRIDMQKIKGIVNNTEGLSDRRKTYILKSVNYRYENILQPIYKRILKAERKKNFSQ